MQQVTAALASLLLLAVGSVNGFTPAAPINSNLSFSRATKAYAPNLLSSSSRFMAEESTDEVTTSSTPSVEIEEPMDDASRLAIERAKKVEELKAQEVFMQRSTGKHKCTNCDWEYDEAKGDSMMIGGLVKPGTPFADLPSNWRCPTCRASKDNFQEVTIEIPGFEVNQGYGFGTNSMTSGQKSGLVFGGLFLFFVLFLGGYGLS